MKYPFPSASAPVRPGDGGGHRRRGAPHALHHRRRGHRAAPARREATLATPRADIGDVPADDHRGEMHAGGGAVTPACARPETVSGITRAHLGLLRGTPNLALTVRKSSIQSIFRPFIFFLF